MSMRLQPKDLAKISTELEKLNDIDAEVNMIRVAGHYIRLKREDSQTDGTWYVIVGISNEERPPGGALRTGTEESFRGRG